MIVQQEILKIEQLRHQLIFTSIIEYMVIIFQVFNILNSCTANFLSIVRGRLKLLLNCNKLETAGGMSMLDRLINHLLFVVLSGFFISTNFNVSIKILINFYSIP